MKIVNRISKKKFSVLLIVLAFLCNLTACATDETEAPVKSTAEVESVQSTAEVEPVKFTAETAFHYHFEKDGYYRDVIMPKIPDQVINSNVINEQLMQYNTLEELQDSEDWANWMPEDSFKRYYTVSNMDGICSLNIIEESLMTNGDGADPNDFYVYSVSSYYYNEKTSKVLSEGEYLESLGYTENDILSLFNQEYGEKYSNRTYDFSHLIFWFDDDNKLRFSPIIIDRMDANTADFALLINGLTFETGSLAPETSPFGKAITSEENFYSEVWAGSWWVEEYYDGAYVLYSLYKDKEEKRPFHVEITKPNTADGFQAYTYRNAALGNTKEQIQALYPEIDPEEQMLLNGTDDLFILQGNYGYLYLEFHFEDDIVTKIAAGTLID